MRSRLFGRMSELSWLPPALGYVLLLGGLGIATKLALQTLVWQELIAWTWLAYSLLVVGLVVLGQAQLHGGFGGAMGALSGLLASSALILFFLALDRGEASRVVPVTSVYPVVGVALAALILGERVGISHIAGTALVVTGVILLTRY